METETAKGLGIDADGEHAVPVAIPTPAAGELPVNLVGPEGHPVDTPITQSTADDRHRVGAAGQVLVGRDGDPVRTRRVNSGQHDHHGHTSQAGFLLQKAKW